MQITRRPGLTFAKMSIYAEYRVRGRNGVPHARRARQILKPSCYSSNDTETFKALPSTEASRLYFILPGKR